MSPSALLSMRTALVMTAGLPQATKWNHWDCTSMASWPHFREAERNLGRRRRVAVRGERKEVK